MQKICEECKKIFNARVSKRRFCSNSCQAKYRERNFTLRFGHRRVFRREISDEAILRALKQSAAGISLAVAAENIGININTLRKRGIELGYKVNQIGRGWHAPTCSLPESIADLAYIAGIVDGEGSIVRHCSTAQMKWILTVVNTDRPLIDWLGTFGGRVYTRTSIKKNLGSKPIYAWNVQAQRDVLAFLGAIAPFMRIKKDKADRAVAEIGAAVAEMNAISIGQLDLKAA